MNRCGIDFTLDDFTSIYIHFKQQITNIDSEFFRFSTVNKNNDLTVIQKHINSCEMLIDSLRSFNKITHYNLDHITNLNDSALFAMSENKNIISLVIYFCGTNYSVDGLRAIFTNCSELRSILLWDCCHISKEDLVSLFEIKNKLMQVDLFNHNNLDAESVISILESTFKHRPDESQGGLIKEKIQMLYVGLCPNVNHDKVEQYLRDNDDCYVVKYNDE